MALRARPRWALALLAAPLLLAGCFGGGDDDDDETPTSAPATATATSPAAASSPTAAATEAEAASPTAAPGEGGEYTVQAGDTLGAIANQFGVTVEAIVEANGLANPDLIEVGQVLIIPAPE